MSDQFHTEEPTPPVYGASIFCDDIRQEINAKQSFIGVYPHSVKIQGQFPATIPRLFISVILYELNELASTRDWEIPIFVLGPGNEINNPIFRGSVPVPPNHARVPPDTKLEGMNQIYMVTSFALSFEPIVINAPGFLLVRALYKDKIIKLGSLRLYHIPPSLQTP
jgi:hypothetical protein